jgi:ubiquitin carboxyl-terminal hydrolase 25/28
VENNVWKGEERGLSITGKAFQKLGWSSHMWLILYDDLIGVIRYFRTSIFESLKYTLPEPNEEKPAAKPPSMASPDIRTLLLRAWAELSCYFAIFLQRYSEVQRFDPVLDLNC